MTSPLPDLPKELKEKQETLGNGQGRRRLASPGQGVRTATDGSVAKKARREKETREDSVLAPVESLRDPIQMVQRIRLEPSRGFLYLSPAVDRSCVNYNYYNFK